MATTVRSPLAAGLMLLWTAGFASQPATAQPATAGDFRQGLKYLRGLQELRKTPHTELQINEIRKLIRKLVPDFPDDEKASDPIRIGEKAYVQYSPGKILKAEPGDRTPEKEKVFGPGLTVTDDHLRLRVGWRAKYPIDFPIWANFVPGGPLAHGAFLLAVGDSFDGTAECVLAVSVQNGKLLVKLADVSAACLNKAPGIDSIVASAVREELGKYIRKQVGPGVFNLVDLIGEREARELDKWIAPNAIQGRVVGARDEARWLVHAGAASPIPWGSRVVDWPADPKRYFLRDFDGDGKTDRAYLAPDGKWFVLSTATHEPVRGLWGHAPAGWPGDPTRMFVADFDGDGKADRAYLSEDAKWHVIDSENVQAGNGVPGIPWGQQLVGWAGDPKRMFVADFDGDCKADRAYLAPDGKWYVIGSKGGRPGDGVPGIPWGQSLLGWPNDPSKIFVADFNGDGLADRAYLAGDAKWYIVSTNANCPVNVPWGDAPPGWPADPSRMFVADFDGDGLADRAYLSQAGKWHIVSSKTNQPVANLPWGEELAGWPADPSAILVAELSMSKDAPKKAARVYLAPYAGSFELVLPLKVEKRESHLRLPRRGDHEPVVIIPMPFGLEQ